MEYNVLVVYFVFTCWVALRNYDDITAHNHFTECGVVLMSVMQFSIIHVIFSEVGWNQHRNRNGILDQCHLSFDIHKHFEVIVLLKFVTIVTKA